MRNSDIIHVITLHNMIVSLSSNPKTEATQDKINDLADDLILFLLTKVRIRDKYDRSFATDVKMVMTSIEKEQEWSNIPPTLPLDVIIIAVIRNILVRHNVSFGITKMKYWIEFSNSYAHAVLSY